MTKQNCLMVQNSILHYINWRIQGDFVDFNPLPHLPLGYGDPNEGRVPLEAWSLTFTQGLSQIILSDHRLLLLSL